MSLTDLVEIKTKIKKTKKSLVNIDGRIEIIFRDLEKDVKYIGIVAVSEVIHPDISKTITKLFKSGIKV